MNYDIIFIGAGPGGYVSAIRSSQLGFKVACIDNFKYDNKYSLGGTCLNVGCIPSKALLQSSDNYYELKNHYKDHGITCSNIKINIDEMQQRKNSIINKNANGISYLFKKNKIAEIHGTASIIGKENGLWVIEIIDQDSKTKISCMHIVLAVGSTPREIPLIKFDNKYILDNEGALALNHVPEKLGIIGSGVIGLELGSVWNRLGSEVTILEESKVFLNNVDENISNELLNQLNKQQLKIHLGTKVIKIEVIKNKVHVDYNDNYVLKSEVFNNLIVAIGRVANTKSLNCGAIGLELDERGFIKVNNLCQTNLENIWAIGDCVRGPMLAHKASEEGVYVAELIAGQKPHFDFNTIPFVIYTNPELAWVGKTEAQLKVANIEYKVGKANFSSNGRALGLGNSVGFIKILSCTKKDRILGVHMVGPYVSELISEAVVAMEFKASSEDLARIIHSHPSLTEVIHEAALACDNRMIHG